jgi:hypothetical protein
MGSPHDPERQHRDAVGAIEIGEPGSDERLPFQAVTFVLVVEDVGLDGGLGQPSP